MQANSDDVCIGRAGNGVKCRVQDQLETENGHATTGPGKNHALNALVGINQSLHVRVHGGIVLAANIVSPHTRRENLFKKCCFQISLFLTLMGICLALLTLPATITIIANELEPLPQLNDLKMLLRPALIQLVIMFFINSAISLTFPLFVSVACALTLPAMALVSLNYPQVSVGLKLNINSITV